MTIKEYIFEILGPFGVTDAHLIGSGLEWDQDCTPQNQNEVGKGVAEILGDILLAPRRNNVSEGGFSVSWDFSNASKFYIHLCRKYEVEPASEIVKMCGISSITDMTNSW